jgi:hypothetical protein
MIADYAVWIFGSIIIPTVLRPFLIVLPLWTPFVRSTLTTTRIQDHICASPGRTTMHFLGGLLLVIVIFWLATRVAGPKAGVGAAAVTTVALMMLNSDGHHHHHHDRLDYDA